MTKKLLLALTFFAPLSLFAGTYHAVNAQYTSVYNCYQDRSQCTEGAPAGKMVDGDVLLIPPGDVQWTTGLIVDNAVSIIGAGSGTGGTTITDNNTANRALGIFNINLNHEPLTGYSFRLSGMKLATIVGSFANDHGAINLTGSPSSTSVYQRGCISGVRIDNMVWSNIPGCSLVVDSVLGVLDHITSTTDRTPIMHVFMKNWTPTTDPATGLAIPSSFKAKNGYGSWADGNNFGTDKFWFVEDCNFTVPSGSAPLGVTDDLFGGRLVFRHNTVNQGTGVACHGMEGFIGVRAREVYNNYFNTPKKLAQTRSGSVLWYNNLLAGPSDGGMGLQDYRAYTTYSSWGGASGDNRYDQNYGSNPIISGAMGTVNGNTLTLPFPANLNLIDLSDGYQYVIINHNDPYGSGSAGQPGYQYYQSEISTVSPGTSSIGVLGFAANPRSAIWVPGNIYEVRKVATLYGSVGTGKGNLLVPDPNVSNAAVTYTYPATSGPMAQHPQQGYPLEPCYSWNNTNNAGFYIGFQGLTIHRGIKEGREVVDLPEQTNATAGNAARNIGFPAFDYPRATSAHPNIGPSPGAISYAPYAYPHPLQNASTSPRITGIVGSVGATSATFSTNKTADCVAPTPVNCITFTSASFSSAPTWSIVSGSIPSGTSLNTATGKISGQPTGITVNPTNFDFTIQADQGADTATYAFRIVAALPNAPPTVSLTAPATGVQGSAPATIVLKATAADSDGGVDHVSFYHETTLIGTATTSPYSVTWTQVPAGSYSLTAVATDTFGDSTTSSPAVSISVPDVLGAPTPPAQIILKP